MTRRKIAVFGALTDPQVVRVTRLAFERGHEVLVVPPERWLGDGAEGHSVRIGPEATSRIRFGDDDLLEAEAAWVRHLVPPFLGIDPSPELGPLDRKTAFVEAMQARERAATAMCALDMLVAQGATVINPPAPGLGIQNKPTQLLLMRRAGARVPETIISDDPEAVHTFAKGRRVVFKPVTGGALARPLDKDLLETLELIVHAPVIFQEHVPGLDVRVTMLDDRILSSVVVETPEGTVDFRADPNYSAGEGTYREIELPPKVQEGLRNARRALGLRFTGIDVRFDPAAPEDYAILEANPSPTYLDVERKMKHPISEGLLDALAG